MNNNPLPNRKPPFSGSRLADVRIDIEPPLIPERDPRPGPFNSLRVQVCVDDGLDVVGLAQDLGHGVGDEAVAPGVVGRLEVPGRAAERDVELVVDGPGARQQLPVQRTRRHVEGARVQQRKGAPACRDGGQLREPYVVADGHAHLAVGGKVHDGHVVAGGEHVRLSERDLARYVNVEEVDLAVGGQQVARGGEDEGRVVVLPVLVVTACAVDQLRDGAGDEVGARLLGHVGQGVVARTLLPGRWGGEQGLGVRWEVVAAVGRVEALWQQDDLCTCARGLDHLVAGMGQVGGLVGAAGQLDAGELDGLLEHRLVRLPRAACHCSDTQQNGPAFDWLLVPNSRDDGC
ncbi:hypothetical protein PspLS_02697 [Pyricularia sp. CBS 133598]|nr:hypothetical protein PspLS_02697 [Pyricularia sp. CBS 133598]